MQPALKSSLLTILYILSVLTIVSSINIPVPVEPAGVCNPNDCNGAFSDTGDYLSYKCSGSSKRGLLTRNTDLIEKRDTPLLSGLSLKPRTINCANCGKIKKAKDKFNGICDPANSKGYKSSHNCKNAGGKSYLCVIGGEAKCYSSSQMTKLGGENG
ncbi:MAG: hypothetical protein Q9203_004122, partial [Teloschistes exilis]